MATSSFEDISEQVWEPTSSYQTLQIMIQSEVEQGLWINQTQPDGWCLIATSDPHGVSDSWVTHTYQYISDLTQTSVVIWPAGWPAPAENINGDLPCHFFASGSTVSNTSVSTSVSTTSTEASSGSMAVPFSQTSAAPTTPPTYRIAGRCV